MPLRVEKPACTSVQPERVILRSDHPPVAASPREPRGRPKKALSVLHVIPHLGQGGAERVLHNLASTAADVRHRIVVMEETVFFNRSGLDIASLDFDLRHRGRSFVALPRAMSLFRNLLKAARPDVVQGWLYYGNLLASAALGLALPVIWSIHNTTLPHWRANPALRSTGRLLALSSALIPDAIVYCAQLARALHERAGYPRRLGIVIPNGVDTATFYPNAFKRAAARHRLGISDQEAAVGLFARFDPQKDIPTCLKAFAYFARRRGRARLVLAGQGMAANNLTLCGLIAAEGLTGSVILLGAVDQMEQVTIAMDAVMLGSRYGEAMPMALLEALVSDVPIVATRIGDVGQLPIPQYSLVPPADPALLGEALLRVIAGGPESWSGSFAKVREEYGLERCVSAYHALYRRLAK